MIKKTFLMAAVASIAFAGAAQARDQIRIVGSSTVFPFSSTVAEQFGRTSGFKTPVVESTGTGGGMKLFCAGNGAEHPDATGASRGMKGSEKELCAASGVEPVELRIGFDGIALANSKKAAHYELTLEQMFLALAKEVPVNGQLAANPYQSWSDIDPSLPNAEIVVLGPPTTSGTRDAFVELVMEAGAESALEGLGLDDDAIEDAAKSMREDGAFVEAGENDNLIVQKLDTNPDALGIFGFSFLEENRDILQASHINGVQPEVDTIADATYPVARSLYLYVKKAHVGQIAGLEEFIGELTSEKAIGPDGYLLAKGFIPLPDSDRNALRTAGQALTPLTN